MATSKNSLVKKILVGLGAVVVLLFIAALVAPMFVPWDKVKAQAEEKISEITHHKITIGKIGFNVFRGVEIRNLRVENAGGFSKDPLLTDEAVIVKYRLLPLLVGKVVMKAIILDKPTLVVEKDAEGRFNFSDMIPAKKEGAEEPKEKEAKEGGPAKLPVSVLISRVAINQASLTYRDMGKKQEYKIDDLNLKVNNITLAGLTPVKVLLDAKIKAMGSTIPLNLKTDWRFSLAKEQFILDSAEVTLPGVLFRAKGTVDQVLSAAALGIAGEIALDFGRIQKELIPADIQAKFPRDFSMSGKGAVTFKVNGPAKQPEALVADVTNQIALQVQAVGLNIPVSLEGGIGFKNADLAVNEKLVVPGLDAALAVKLADAMKAKNLSTELKASLDLGTAAAKLVPPGQASKLSDVKASGQVGVTAKVNGPLSQMEKLMIAGQVQAKAVSVDFQKKSVLDDVNALVALAPDKIALTSLSGKLAGQPLKASFSAAGFDLRKPETLKPAALKAKVLWNVESPLLNLDALMALVPESKDKKAKTGDQTAQTGTDTQPEAGSKAETGKPEPVASELMPAGLDLQGKAKLGGMKFGKVTFGKLDYDMTIKQRVFNNTVSLQGYKGVVGAQAKLDFTGKILAYDIKADVKTVDLEPLLNDVLETYAATKSKKPEIIQEIKDKIVGTLSGRLTMNGRGMKPAAAMANLKGQGNFTLLNGRIRKFSFQPALAKLFGSDRFDQDIPFDHTLIDFTIADQMVNLTKFVLESGEKGQGGDIRMNAHGLITFKAEFKDFRLRPALSPRASSDLSPQVRQYSAVLKDDQGWTNIPVIMNGPMSKPDVQPDLEWIKGQFSNYLSKKGKAVTEEAGKKVQDFFKKAQGKNPDEVKKDAAEEIEKAKEKLKDFKLNNLF